MSYTPIPALPTPPNSIARPGTFVADSDATFGALPGVVDAINANLPTIQAAADSAPVAIAAANYKGLWSSLAGGQAIPASVSHAGKVWMLLESVADVAAHEPGVSSKWRRVSEPLGLDGASSAGALVLTSTSAAMQRVAPTAWGQAVTLPDATALPTGVPLFGISNAGGFDLPLRDAAGALLGFIRPGSYALCSLSGKATAAGDWDVLGAELLGVDVGGTVTTATGVGTGVNLARAALSGGRELLVLWGNTSAHALVYDPATGSFGSPALVHTGTILGAQAVAVGMTGAADKVVCFTGVSATLRATVLTVTGTSIGVGTPADVASTTVTALDDVHAIGSSAVLQLEGNGNRKLRAVDASGATPVWGAEVFSAAAGSTPFLTFVRGAMLVCFYGPSTSNVSSQAVTVAGSTLTLGGAASIAVPTNVGLSVRELDTGRWAVIAVGSVSADCALFALAGTVMTVSALVSAGPVLNPSLFCIAAITGGKVFIGGSGGINVVTDNAGTPVAGTILPVPVTGNLGAGPDFIWVQAANAVARIGVLAGSPVLLQSAPCVPGAAAAMGMGSVVQPKGKSAHSYGLLQGRWCTVLEGANPPASTLAVKLDGGVQPIAMQRPAVGASTNGTGTVRVTASSVWVLAALESTAPKRFALQRLSIA